MRVPTITTITYKITRVDDVGNYFVYTDSDEPLISDLVSYSFKCSKRDLLSFTANLTAPIRRYLVEHHAPEVFPCFRFTGDTTYLFKECKRTPVLIYNNPPAIDPDQNKQHWIKMLSFFVNFTLLGGDADWTSVFSTSDHAAAMSWISYQAGSDRATPKTPDGYSNIMQRWYGADKSEQLRKGARLVIIRFLLHRELDMYIPACLIVPVYHIRRYAKAMKMIERDYDPAFVMSLPLKLHGDEYTVLFPVLRGQNLHYHKR